MCHIILFLKCVIYNWDIKEPCSQNIIDWKLIYTCEYSGDHQIVFSRKIACFIFLFRYKNLIMTSSLGKHQRHPRRFQSLRRINICKSQRCSHSDCLIRKFRYRKCYTHRCPRSRCWAREHDQTDRCNDILLVCSRKSVLCHTRVFLLDIHPHRRNIVQTRGPRYNRARKLLWTRICKIFSHIFNSYSNYWHNFRLPRTCRIPKCWCTFA